jgi:hypothetical protein
MIIPVGIHMYVSAVLPQYHLIAFFRKVIIDSFVKL